MHTSATQSHPLVVGIARGEGPRVALVPADVGALVSCGFQVVVEAGAGERSGCPDQAYLDAGARVGDAQEVRRVDVMACLEVSTTVLGAAPCRVVGIVDAQRDAELLAALRDAGHEVHALELVPRTTRAQAMDVLSSQAALAGYQATLMAAERLDRVLPMMSTAAGTLPPARVLVLGAGVAGLQAIATARRLGARVSAYDVRAAAREQVVSVGGEFLELGDQPEVAADANGYAAEQSDEQQARQRALLTRAVAEADAVICTALVQGRPAPVILDAAMVTAMRPGSVVVDLAASHGGNCAATLPGQETTVDGVRVIGLLDVVERLAADASRLFSRNMATFCATWPRTPARVRPRSSTPIPCSPPPSSCGTASSPETASRSRAPLRGPSRRPPRPNPPPGTPCRRTLRLPTQPEQGSGDE